MEGGKYLRPVKPSWNPPLHFASSRKLEILKVQLKVGCNLLNRTRSLFKGSSDLCPTCGVRESRDHYLLNCVTVQRQDLFRKLKILKIESPINSRTLLDPDLFPPKTASKIQNHLEEFISSTGRFRTMKFSV